MNWKCIFYIFTSLIIRNMVNKFCILCKHSKFKIVSSQVRDSKYHKVIKCLKCDHVQLYPIPTPEEDKEFYDKEMQSVGIKYFFSLNELRRLSVSDVNRRSVLIQKTIQKNKKILEIGSGDGFFLEKMQNYGYKMTGIEVSKHRRIKSRKTTNVKVLDIDLVQNVPNIGSFDGIVLFHVLEHIRDPINFLKNILKLLKPRGKLIVEVPNFNDFQIKLNNAYRDWQYQSYFTYIISLQIF